LKKTEFIWMNGSIIPWEQATVHVLSHVVHYGTSWFEGIRCYNTKKGPAIFQLVPHLNRFHTSAKIYRTEIPYSIDQLVGAIKEIIKANKLDNCYIRPVAYRGFGELGVYPLRCPVETVIAVWEWGSYLGQDSIEKGIDVMTSSWRRFPGSTLPSIAKAGGNYMNAQLIKMEAIENGYAEGIVLDAAGHVCEGSGENLFLIKDGAMYTPPLSSGILPGITRSVVMHLARKEGIEVHETVIPRDYVYMADEVFFTGTAAEITPIRSIDKIFIGQNKPGAVTRLMQERFFDVTRGGNDPFGWLTWLD
jgi:branched-chain amino acid aminotransferase